MKRNITGILFMMNLWMVANTQQMNLQRALDLKLVKAVVKSLGGYQGFCTQMELKNLGGDSLIILVEAGRRLNSINEKEQDILITQQQLITLKKMETRSFPVKGYCCQASNSAPSRNALYSVNKMADSSLVKLACYLNSHDNEPSVEQQAIWAISDNKPVSMVSSVKDTVLSGLKLMVCILKGVTMPWYSLITKTLLCESGAMLTYPIWLRGKMSYDNDKECYTTLHVLDEKGLEVAQIVQQWTLPGKGQNYNLNIPVGGLPKGKYTIELKSTEKQLAKKEFEI